METNQFVINKCANNTNIMEEITPLSRKKKTPILLVQFASLVISTIIIYVRNQPVMKS